MDVDRAGIIFLLSHLQETGMGKKVTPSVVFYGILSALSARVEIET